MIRVVQTVALLCFALKRSVWGHGPCVSAHLACSAHYSEAIKTISLQVL